jgi:hypothetical protein
MASPEMTPWHIYYHTNSPGATIRNAQGGAVGLFPCSADAEYFMSLEAKIEELKAQLDADDDDQLKEKDVKIEELKKEMAKLQTQINNRAA